MSLNHEMSSKHETWLARILGGRKTPGSGNQARNPMDGRHNRYDVPYAFAWDGKSTRGVSISVNRGMLDKAVLQADGERPMIALRFYDDDRLRGYEDWFLVRADDFIEMREDAIAWSNTVAPRS